MRNKWSLILVSVLLSVVLMVAGCGKKEASPAPTPAPAAEQPVKEEGAAAGKEAAEPELTAEGWIDFATFVKMVKKSKWQFREFTTEYTYNGSEKVEGIAADKVTVSSRSEYEVWEFTMWVDGTL